MPPLLAAAPLILFFKTCSCHALIIKIFHYSMDTREDIKVF